ncbi:hypothetical protein VP01_3401g4 [Puccinia sorghi]|uniref:Uncharacterized protein n=1 Tax=Puccinia sorghi TaxID=27349 RepID=A0A0L6UWJ4_9BASI|nr:hypothetical protein VP01_3401g4 [Puccinia sorghi]
MAYENKLVLNLLQTNWLLPTPNKPLLKLQLLRNQIERVYPSNLNPLPLGQSSKFPKGSPLTAKKKLNQKDYPKEFLGTKECIFMHIQLLWGMVKVRTPQQLANPELVSRDI